MGGCAARQRPPGRIAEYLLLLLLDHQIWLMTLYGKDEVSDLTAQQKKALKVAIEEELATRAAMRRARRRG
jgi:hypothetical protein